MGFQLPLGSIPSRADRLQLARSLVRYKGSEVGCKLMDPFCETE